MLKLSELGMAGPFGQGEACRSVGADVAPEHLGRGCGTVFHDFRDVDSVPDELFGEGFPRTADDRQSRNQGAER